MLLSKCACELDDSLHPRDLSFDIWVEVLFAHSREVQEMNGAIVLLTGW
jgi:hypothetical protein